MIIKKLILENFRQFHGSNELVFSTSENKNVTIILGNNGAGKTTLNQAFLFCLYGIDKVRFNDFIGTKADKNKTASIRKICNNLSFNKGNENFRVGVRTVFEHNNIEYDIYRYYDYQWSKKLQSYTMLFENFDDSKKIQKGDKAGAVQVRESELRNILPEALSPMFFFDGERMEKLASNESKNVLSSAVINILDLLPYRVALSRLKSKEQPGFNNSVSKTVESILRRELKQTVSDGIDYAEEIDKIEFKRDVIYENREKAKFALENIKSENNETLEEIKKLSANKAEQEKRQQLLDENRNIERLLLDNQTAVNDLFSEKFSAVLLKDYFDIVNKTIQTSVAKDRDIKGINTVAIDTLIERKKCLCGAELLPGSTAYKKVLEWKEFLPPKDLSSLLVSVRDGMNSQLDEAQKFETRFKELKEAALRQRSKLAQNEEAIELIIENNSALEQCKTLEIKLKLNTSSEVSIRNKIKDYDNQISIIDDEKDRLERKLKESTITNGQNDAVIRKIDLLEKVYNKILDSSEKKEAIAKTFLAELASKNYRDIEQKDYELVLNSNYSYDILNGSKQSITSALSEGEKVVASFSFIGALVRVAKELNKKLQEDGSQEYPLVMDAPFAKLDIEHRGNVALQLPDFASQIIIFSADSQWEGIIKDTLYPKVSALYKLTFDKIREVSSLDGGLV